MTPSEQQKADFCGRHEKRTEPMFHRIFLADAMNVRSVLTDLRRRFRDEVSDDALGRLELVLAEIMNNVAKHGHVSASPGERPASSKTVVHLCIVRHETGLACAVTDDGVSLPDHCLLPRALPQEQATEMPEGGFGWYLIQDLTQSLCYYREGRRNFLAFSVPFVEPDAPAIN